jgi:hypothetical protein
MPVFLHASLLPAAIVSASGARPGPPLAARKPANTWYSSLVEGWLLIHPHHLTPFMSAAAASAFSPAFSYSITCRTVNTRFLLHHQASWAALLGSGT